MNQTTCKHKLNIFMYFIISYRSAKEYQTEPDQDCSGESSFCIMLKNAEQEVFK